MARLMLKCRAIFGLFLYISEPTSRAGAASKHRIFLATCKLCYGAKFLRDCTQLCDYGGSEVTMVPSVSRLESLHPTPQTSHLPEIVGD